VENQLTDLLAPYREQKGVKIQVLQKTQEESGYLPREAVDEIARSLRIPPSEIFAGKNQEERQDA